MELERRAFRARELRVAGTQDGPPSIAGHAALFNVLSEDLGGFREKIAPGAFTATLKEDDQRALVNHDPYYVLARRRNGTLSLVEDAEGLGIEAIPPDTQWARDLLVSMRRGDIDQMSFAFQTIRDNWEIVGDEVIRTLLEVRLWEVSVVTFAAYPQTTAHVRSRAEEVRAASQAAGRPGGEGGQSQGGLAVLERELDILNRA